MNEDTVASPDDRAAVCKPRPKVRGRVTIIRERCKGCSYCVAFCPTGVLEMSPDFNVKGYHFPRLLDGRDCSGCDLCGMYCPDFAVSGARLPGQGNSEETSKE
jgi:2-oxoglutarate ferredoxin oxidoreductase subunit delta